MAHNITQARFLSEFQCTGDRCPDTCCKGWNMQLDSLMHERYQTQAPELLSAVARDEAGDLIMKRDATTDYCVRFEDGLCGIHKKYGSDFLGDACHFYPRVTRALGSEVLMTATPSCPEVARLAFYLDDAFVPVPTEVDRVPFSLKNYLPEGVSAEQARAVNAAFIASVGEAPSAEQAFARIASVARSLAHLPQAGWADAIPFYLKMADGRLPAPMLHPADAFNVLHALCGLTVATRKTRSPRLMETISAMENALAVTLDWEQVGITLSDDSEVCLRTHKALWDEVGSDELQPVLKRWLQLQLSVGLFPFAGLGATPSEKITLIGVRFATFRLALMCERGMSESALPQDVVVRIAQSLARVLDHLADPAFSLQVYEEVGWKDEARMLGLVLG